MANPYNATSDNAKEKAGTSARDAQDDIETLRREVSKLTQQLAEMASQKGSEVWEKTKSNLDGVIAGAEAKGQEAVDAVRDVSDNVVKAIDKSLKDRPYTTLALALGFGFLFGATWRR